MNNNTPLEKATDEEESGSAGTRDGMTTTSLSCWLAPIRKSFLTGLVQHPSDLFGIVKKDSRPIPDRAGTSAGMTEGGFTLIELVIATTIILIVSLGFFGWASTIIQTNLSIERNNTAYTMAMDVAERLQRMSDNTLITHTTANKRCVGYASSGDSLKGCSVPNCAGGTPTGNLKSGETGMTIYTNPWNGTTNQLYLYDNNACVNTTWLTGTCRTGSTITTGANANIDHPNVAGSYDSINPIRSYRNTTYYAVWSVAYLPCNAGTNTDRRKIFVTVYWIDPEPTDTDLTNLPGRIAAGTATVKSVSIVVDKAIGTES